MAPKDYRKAPRPGETLGPTPAPEDRHLDIPDSLRWMDPSSNHNYQKAQAKRQQEDLQRLHKAQVAQPQPQESQQQPRIGQQQQSNPGRLPNIQYHSRYDVQHQYRPRGIDLPTHPPGALDEQISAPGQQQQRNRLKRDHTTMDQAQQDLWNKRIKFCEEERERDAEEKRAALNIRGHILQARQRQSAKERTQARNAEKDRQKRQDRIDHDLRVTHLPTKSEFEARETARRVLSAKLMDCTKRGVLEQVIGSGGLHGWMEKTITNNDAQTVPTGYDWSWRQKQYRPEERMSDRIDRMVGGMIGEDQEELQEQLRLDREAYIASQAKASKHGNRQPLGDARGHGAVAKTAVARSTHPIGVGPRSAVVKTNGRGSEKNVLFENGIISHLPDDEIINRNRKHRRRASGNPEAQDGSDDRALASDVALFLNKEEEDPAGLLRDLSGSIEEDVDTNSLAKHVKQRSCNGKAGNQDGTSDEDDFDAASSVIADTRLVSKELVGGDQAAFEDSLAVEWLQIFLHEFTSDGFSTAVDQSQSHSVAHAKMAKARVPVISSANVGKPAEELGNSSTPSPAPSQTTQPRKQDSSCSSDENTYDVGNSHDSVCSGSQVEADDTFEKEMQDSAEDYDADMGQEEWKMFTTANTRTTRPAQSFAPSSPRRSQTNPEFWSLGFFDAGQPQVTQVIQDLTKDTYDIEKNADEDARNHDWALAHNREEGKIPLPKLMEFAHGDIDYKVYTYDCLDDYLEQHEAHQPMSIDPTNSYVMSTYCPQDYDGEAWVFSREEFDPRNRDDTYDSNEFSVPSNATTNENHPHCPIRNEQGGGGGQTSGGPQNTCIDRRDWAPQNWETIKLAPLSLDSGEKIPWKTVLDSYKVTSGLFKSFRSNAESIKCQPRETLDQRLQLDNQLKELASQRQHLKNSIQQTRYAEHHHAQQMARHVELKRRENTNSAAERQDPKLEGCQKADLIRMFQRRIDDPKLDRYNLNIVDPTKPLPIPNLDFSPYNQGSSVANSATPNNMTTTLLESASDPPVTILQSPPVQSTQSPPQKGDEVSSMQTNSSTDRKPPTPTGSTVHKSPDFIGYWLSLRKMSIFDSGDKPSSIPGFIDQIEGGLEVLLKLVNNPYVANSTSDELFELEAKYNKLARKYAEAASQPSSSPYCGFGSKMSKIGADFETIGGILQKLMPPATQDDTQAKDKNNPQGTSAQATSVAPSTGHGRRLPPSAVINANKATQAAGLKPKTTRTAQSKKMGNGKQTADTRQALGQSSGDVESLDRPNPPTLSNDTGVPSTNTGHITQPQDH